MLAAVVAEFEAKTPALSSITLCGDSGSAADALLAAAGFVPPTTPIKTHTDYSASSKMADAVRRKWNELLTLHKRGELDMDEWRDKMFTNGVPSKRKFAEKVVNLPASSFRRYVNDDESKRTKLGTKLGRKRKDDSITVEAAIKKLRKTNALLEQNKTNHSPDSLQKFYTQLKENTDGALRAMEEHYREWTS